MNPERTYREYRDAALAKQITATSYSTFVAMPFGSRFSYRSGDVFRSVITAAAKTATERSETPFPFADPVRADTNAGPAVVITDEIVRGILESHVFLADLTNENAGVLLETGVALGLKSNRQIVLIMQGAQSELHFDIRNNFVISYDRDGAIDVIAGALIGAALAFEEQRDRHVTLVTKTLSPDAIYCLGQYGYLRKKNPGQGFSLHEGSRGEKFSKADGVVRFAAATKELRDKGLLYTDYTPGKPPKVDKFGSHATELGWAVMEHLWEDLRGVKEADA